MKNFGKALIQAFVFSHGNFFNLKLIGERLFEIAEVIYPAKFFELIGVCPKIVAANFSLANTAQTVDQQHLIFCFQPGVQFPQILLSVDKAGRFRRGSCEEFGVIFLDVSDMVNQFCGRDTVGFCKFFVL